MRDLKVLYVEDDEITRMVLFRRLKEEYSEVYEAENGAEGLRLYKEHKPDVVITDLTMPVMSGTEMIIHIKNIRAGQPFIVLTGYYEDCSALEGCAIVKKPIVANDVFQKIDALGL